MNRLLLLLATVCVVPIGGCAHQRGAQGPPETAPPDDTVTVDGNEVVEAPKRPPPRERMQRWIRDRRDLDDDGFSPNAGDCDDENPDRSPDAAELCNQLDDDCDFAIDEDLRLITYYPDADWDGYTVDADKITTCEIEPPPRFRPELSNPPDCDDSQAFVYPNALELTDDGIDNDCDGIIDEEILVVNLPAMGAGAGTPFTAAPLRAGLVNGPPTDRRESTRTQEPIPAEEKQRSPEPPPPLPSKKEEPVATPTPPRRGEPDKEKEQDSTPEPPTPTPVPPQPTPVPSAPMPAPAPPPTARPQQRVVPEPVIEAPSTPAPVAQELCDGTDNDNDGQTDEGFDQDNDTWFSCLRGNTQPDCDDTNAAVHPNATELCDGKDNNCDGQQETLERLHVDQDRDGYGHPTVSKETCLTPGFVKNANDCNDTDKAIHPAAKEVCGDNVDNNCDKQKDEQCKHAAVPWSDGDVILVGFLLIVGGVWAWYAFTQRIGRATSPEARAPPPSAEAASPAEHPEPEPPPSPTVEGAEENRSEVDDLTLPPPGFVSYSRVPDELLELPQQGDLPDEDLEETPSSFTDEDDSELPQPLAIVSRAEREELDTRYKEWTADHTDNEIGTEVPDEPSEHSARVRHIRRP